MFFLFSFLGIPANLLDRWPVIIGIIVGVVIALSIIWCLVRCLCCGLECCCSCFSCCTSCASCCSSASHRNRGYQQQQPTPVIQQYPRYAQYHSAPAPVYGQQRSQPQYARFDAPSHNPDALPAMPSWDNARTLQHPDHDVEMGQLHSSSAAAPMLPKSPNVQASEYPYQQHAGAYGGDLGAAQYSPYEDQYGYGNTAYQSPRVTSPAPPPSYHSEVPASGVARKPVAGTWRDL